MPAQLMLVCNCPQFLVNVVYIVTEDYTINSYIGVAIIYNGQRLQTEREMHKNEKKNLGFNRSYRFA
ncbi:MAG: hypothetical protein WCS30_12690, partial [Selenomonadaceae bacterium]